MSYLCKMGFHRYKEFFVGTTQGMVIQRLCEKCNKEEGR